MPKKNKLAIYLIKDEYANDDDKILKGSKTVLGGYGEKLGFAPTDNTPTEAILDGTKRKIKVIL